MGDNSSLETEVTINGFIMPVLSFKVVSSAINPIDSAVIVVKNVGNFTEEFKRFDRVKIRAGFINEDVWDIFNGFIDTIDGKNSLLLKCKDFIWKIDQMTENRQNVAYNQVVPADIITTLLETSDIDKKDTRMDLVDLAQVSTFPRNKESFIGTMRKMNKIWNVEHELFSRHDANTDKPVIYWGEPPDDKDDTDRILEHKDVLIQDKEIASATWNPELQTGVAATRFPIMYLRHSDTFNLFTSEVPNDRYRIDKIEYGVDNVRTGQLRPPYSTIWFSEDVDRKLAEDLGLQKRLVFKQSKRAVRGLTTNDVEVDVLSDVNTLDTTVGTEDAQVTDRKLTKALSRRVKRLLGR